jgi:hypothetical protein
MSAKPALVPLGMEIHLKPEGALQLVHMWTTPKPVTGACMTGRAQSCQCQNRRAHLGHEELDARDAEQRVQELLAHALEQVGVAHVAQVQVAKNTPSDGCREYVQHLHDNLKVA